AQEASENNNDGWETVGKKHPKQSHKVVKDSWHGYKQAASEQEYSSEFEDSEALEPSEQELSDLSCACNKLWELDTNRLIPEKDYQIDCGDGKKVYQKDDMAEGSLFCWLSDDVFRKPTYSRFCSLLDNYNPNEGSKEVVTSEEKQEQAAFIEEISRTAPIKYLHKYLAAKGIVSGDRQDFKRCMSSLWFDLYNRGGTYGSSSAFEHVFVGEIKQRGEQEVSGFHNWLQPDSESQLLTIQFEWNGVLKSVSSTMIGVSPEFEMALYTLCFYAGGEENHVELGPYSVNIKCYRLGNRLGSAFPMG
ncbi:Uridylate-specific endoribonuclease B, partial [Linum grandiflorum]